MPIDFYGPASETELDYCLRRETEERAAAASARDVSARDAHADMAERYADKAHMSCESTPGMATLVSGLWVNRERPQDAVEPS